MAVQRTKIFEDDQVILWSEIGDGWTGISAQPKPGSLADNEQQIHSKVQQALAVNAAALALPDPTPGNQAYLRHAAIPSGTLTTAQLSSIVRTLSDQVDSLTRQNNALVSQVQALTRQMSAVIRLAQGLFDTTDDT